MLGDVSPLTCRSYAFDLLRWHRLLWCLGIRWEKATEAEVAAMVGWLRAARNPQRERRQPGSAPAGSVNLKTGKPSLRAGYAPATINHALTVVHGFYSFHGRFRDGPVVNPVPASAQRRQVLAHRSPLEPVPVVPGHDCGSGFLSRHPDRSRMHCGMSCSRRWARTVTVRCWSSTSARRAGERAARGDPGGRRLGRAAHLRRVQGHQDPPADPASPDAFRHLSRYLAAGGLPPEGEPVWRTRRGEPRPMTYWAMRRVLQRANNQLGTNWTLHDARHTAATRMAGDERLTLAEVQTILRHAHLDTTGRYLTARIEDMHDKLQEHYTRPRPQRSYPAGYDPDDIKAVFGG